MSDFATRRMTMVDTQVRPSDVTKFPIIDAMLQVPREAYVPDAAREAAYVGGHVVLNATRVVLEARSFAKMLDALDISPEDTVLDIGAGLGYSTALLARLAHTVVGVESDPEMAAEALRVLASQGVDNAVIVSAALSEGAAKHGPYDAIVFEGGVEVVPAGLLAQLKDGGRVAAIFMEGALGTVKIGVKLAGVVTWNFAFNATAPVLPGFEKVTGFKL